MFPELNGVLKIDSDSNLSGLSVLVTETNTDGTFVLHHFLSSYLRHGWNVCLVNFNQSFTHYNVVGNKLGVNLSKAKEQGHLVIIEGLKNIGAQVLASSLNTESCDFISKDLIDFSAGKLHSLKPLFLHIKDMCSMLVTKQSSPTLVIIDDLSVLLSLGVPISGIFFFMHYLKQLIGQDQTTGLLSLIHCSKDDEEIELLARQLEHSSDICIDAQGLDSGYCKDVHGEITVRRAELKPEKSVTKRMQFKISDKMVSFFALGTSAAVL